MGRRADKEFHSQCSFVLYISLDLELQYDWGQEEKGTTEDEMAGWHHRLNGYEFD